jgi:hypothetical protein
MLRKALALLSFPTICILWAFGWILISFSNQKSSNLNEKQPKTPHKIS